VYYGSSNDNAQFKLEEAGATNISWYFDDAPNTVLGTSSTIIVPYPNSCVERWITVKYRDASGRWRVCCRLIWFCNPFNCNQIKVSYTEGSGFRFELDQAYQNMSWVIDETNQALGSGVQSNFYAISGTECFLRTATVRYRDALGRWWICCYRFWWCNPSNCSEKINITPNGTNYLVSTDNTAQNITWFRDGVQLGTGNNLTTTLPSTGTYKIYIRYYNISNKAWYWCCRTYTPGGGGTPPWTPLPTGDNHTLIVPSSIQSNINGTPLKIGDYVGVFFNKNGQYICSNFMKWEGTSNSFPAYGNQANAPDKNGFNTNDIFMFKVWRASESKEYDVTATYQNPPQTPNDATDKWKLNGISTLIKLDASSSVTQVIPLRSGWNMISSYVMPEKPNMLEILAILGNKITLIKDEDGKSTIPSLGINGIGNWDIKKGYQVRVTENINLPIIGIKSNPATESISISDKWKIISYLCDNGNPPAQQFASINNSIALIKDQDGKTYIPSASIDNIKCMKPGLGYQVRGTANASFNYNCVGNCTPFKNDDIVHSRVKYNTENSEPFNTGNNATLVINEDISKDAFQIGDELKIYNSAGLLCGKGKYEGRAFTVAIWGDDLTTENFIDGLLEGEPFTSRIKDVDGKLWQVEVNFINDMKNYQVDGIYYVRSLTRKMIASNTDILIYPNPSSSLINIQFDSQDVDDYLELKIFDVQGKLVKSYTPDKLSKMSDLWSISTIYFDPGVYIFKIIIGSKTYNKRVLITR